ncbi:hypothetical protein A2690_00940 [Candidatus Roizmanbacteria bacterium RIFCSPHIGHO2_01_FULL_39_12b]|uniref:HIT domain-containing protein n=1 Tax=Candidatus Roizmanbacteria bacterium RIFCSPHIGHO2_01_FULL_39_12b TaxID=1802030 RepID=A0A1F7GAU1_9BACT|nr:MAG: hypothetical protein A2690_00940 [Candidatus Roizmanbacteria bacterium RIFCSPHIGHO2_01_FULL_39_12b]OGK47352.1 MAG: hypothetical protein A3B46_02195 [Candidatus Roizmanbacteria bacterium RIFCSPLOWO2_01_FULL_39_19]
MENCIFCKIVKGQISSYKVFKDENFFAFLDIHPASPGHTLLIPKKHIRWVHDVEPFDKYWEVARIIMRKLDMALDPQWIQYFVHGAIPHAHIHIIPRYDDVTTAQDLLQQSGVTSSNEELAEVAEKIRQTA